MWVLSVGVNGPRWFWQQSKERNWFVAVASLSPKKQHMCVQLRSLCGEGKGERCFIKQPLGPACRAGLAKKNFFPAPSATERAVIPSHTATWDREMLQAKCVGGVQQAALMAVLRRALGFGQGKGWWDLVGCSYVGFLSLCDTGRGSQSGEALPKSLLLILSFPYFEMFLWLLPS